jgi:ATP-binding cassette subfamily C (CFTR/MRP) protein 1
VQIVLCIYFIYQELEEATFAGLGMLVLVTPVTAVIGGLAGKFTREMMKEKDERVKLMSEILSGAKVLKLYGWENSFIEQISGIRDKEVKVLRKTAYLTAGLDFVWVSVPFLMSLAFFVTYIFMAGGQVLTPEKAFVTVSYLAMLTIPMSIFPLLVIFLVQSRVSLTRVNSFMNSDDIPHDAVTHDRSEKDPVVVEKGTFRWGKDEPVSLSEINIRVKEGSLTAVVGAVGSGKSSLIAALLGDLEKDQGSVNISVNSIAYVPQQAWMRNAKLKDNILFSKEYESAKYDTIIKACALQSDLDILPGGDQTEIGEKGINLSGGQKQRISLARSCYSDADLYLLDDPLSAVDAHVGKHIFEEVIGPTGMLKTKTRLLVTHGVTYLPKTDHIIVLKDGKVSEQGSYKELIERKGDFAEFLLEYMTGDGVEAEEDIGDIMAELQLSLGTENFRKELQRQVSRKDSVSSTESGLEQRTLRRRITRQDPVKEEANKGEDSKAASATLIEEEVAATGAVGRAVYGYYLKSIGLTGVLVMMVMQVVFQSATLGTSLWMEAWTGGKLGDAAIPENRNLYISVYAVLGIVQGVANLALSMVMALSTLKASRGMHAAMLKNVLRAPMSFFESTPVGRILNRFAKDVDVCDTALPQFLGQFMYFVSSFVGTVVLIIIVIPIFAAFIVPIAILFVIVQQIYVATSRQLKRLESITRSPIYTHFGETLNGTSTIRAFGMQDNLVHENEENIDKNQTTCYPTMIANRWLAVRLETIGNLITFAVSIIALTSEDIEPSEIGLIITYSLSVTQIMSFMVRATADVENNIVAVERIREYTNRETEAEWESSRDGIHQIVSRFLERFCYMCPLLFSCVFPS